jgi:hypothetical protein
MNYAIYEFMLTVFARAYRKGMGLSKKTDDLIARTVADCFARPSFLETQIAATIVDELTQWIENRVIFVATKELVELLDTAKFDICVESFVAPHPVFLLALPKETGLPGCLVLVQTPAERTKSMEKANKKYGVLVASPRPESVLSLNYTLGSTSFRVCAPLRLIPECLRGPQQMDAAIGRLPGRDTLDLTPAELQIQYKLLRLVCATCIYIRAFPEVLRAGYPSTVTGTVKDQYMPAAKPFTVHAPVRGHHEGPREHYRRWHFRSLRSERYKRDADGHVRVVLVRETLVGGKIVPETVVTRKK